MTFQSFSDYLTAARSNESFSLYLYHLVIIVFFALPYTNACCISNEKGKNSLKQHASAFLPIIAVIASWALPPVLNSISD